MTSHSSAGRRDCAGTWGSTRRLVDSGLFWGPGLPQDTMLGLWNRESTSVTSSSRRKGRQSKGYVTRPAESGCMSHSSNSFLQLGLRQKVQQRCPQPQQAGPAPTSLPHHAGRETMLTPSTRRQKGHSLCVVSWSRKDQMNYSTYSVLRFYHWIDSYGSSQTRALFLFRL